MLYAYITGGGTKWIYDSLKNGGASKWFLGARIPYNQKDFNEILGGEPFDGKYVSKRTAAQLSTAAYTHAVKITGNEKESIGLGVTAKLGTKGQRKDRDNKIIICLTRNVNGYLRSYTVEHNYPNWYPRILQEVLSSYHIERLVKLEDRFEIHNACNYLHLSDLKVIDVKSIIVYSGSFNPIHESHRDIIRYVKESFKGSGAFTLEISTRNVHKGYISPLEMEYRDTEIYNKAGLPNLCFSKESTFIEKARVLKANGWTSIIFPMGDDTYDRITYIERDELSDMGVKLLVFRRFKDELMDDHSVIHRDSFKLPKLKNLSSSEIRKQNAI